MFRKIDNSTTYYSDLTIPVFLIIL